MNSFLFYGVLAVMCWLAVILSIHVIHWLHPRSVDRWLVHAGLRVSLTAVTYSTQSGIGAIARWSHDHRRPLNAFYNAGTCVCLTVCVLAIPYLLYNLASMIIAPDEPLVLQPIIPGVSVPVTDLLFWFAALSLCAVVHEGGHAVASMISGCPVRRFGFMLMVGFPAAFAEIDASLEEHPRWTRLRVFCAGAWHNFVLCAAVLLLIVAMPTLSSPLYRVDTGVYVVSSATAAIPVGTVITAVNGGGGDHPVTSQHTWMQAMRAISRHPHVAPYCIARQAFQVGLADSSCCLDNYMGGLLCVEFEEQLSCVRAKASLSGQCDAEQDEPHRCLAEEHCVQPVLEPGLQLIRIGESLMSASPQVIYDGVVTSNYVPKWSWLPSRAPDLLVRQLMYILSLSSALGLLNLLPVYFLDGSHIAEAVVSRRSALIVKVIVSMILFLNLMISIKIQFSA